MSRYHTLYANSSTKFVTLSTTLATSTSTVMTSRRITVISNGAHFMDFNTSTASTSSFVVPAGAVLDFNFVPGQRIAFITHAGTGHVTIIDAD